MRPSYEEIFAALEKVVVDLQALCNTHQFGVRTQELDRAYAIILRAYQWAGHQGIVGKSETFAGGGESFCDDQERESYETK